MIQRVQSIYLFLATVAIILMYAFNVWQATGVNGEVVEVNVLSTKYFLPGLEQASIEAQIWTSLLSVLIIIIGLGNIMLYRNRLLQIKMARMNILLSAALLILLFYYIDRAKELLTSAIATSSHEPGVFMPFVAMIFFFMVSRSIASDEKLVRSADRLR